MSALSEQYWNSLTPAQQQAATATGAQPGGPNHDAWFQNAKASGAVGAVNNPGGGGVGTPLGQPGGGGSAGRVTAADVRANAQKYGLSEDYARFSDAELNDWVRRWNYDPATGKFTNKYGDQVDKPDERGPNTPPNMNGTGDRGNYGAGVGGGGGRGGPAAQQPGGFVDDSYLQNVLTRMTGQGAGFMGEDGLNNQGQAVRLNEGGVWWAPQPDTPPPAPTAAPPAPGAPAPGAPPPAPPAALAPGGGESPWDAFAPIGGVPTKVGRPTAPGGGVVPGFPQPPGASIRERNPVTTGLGKKYGASPPAWWKQ